MNSKTNEIYSFVSQSYDLSLSPYNSEASQLLRHFLTFKQLSLFCRITGSTYSYIHQLASGKVTPSFALMWHLKTWIEPEAWFRPPIKDRTYPTFEAFIAGRRSGESRKRTQKHYFPIVNGEGTFRYIQRRPRLSKDPALFLPPAIESDEFDSLHSIDTGRAENGM